MLKEVRTTNRFYHSFEWKFLFCTILIGMVCGMMSLFLWQTTIASFGLSMPTTISLFLVCSFAFERGWNRSEKGKQGIARTLLFSTLILVCWTAAFPFLCSWLLQSFSLLSSDLFNNDFKLFFPVLAVITILFCLPCYLTGVIPTLLNQLISLNRKQESTSETSPFNSICSIYFGSLAFGLFLNLFLLSPTLGLYQATCCSCLLTGMLFLIVLRTVSKECHLSDEDSITIEKAALSPFYSTSNYLVFAGVSLLIGISASIMSMQVNQLWPSFAQQIYSQLGMVLVGLSFGFAISGWKKINSFKTEQFLTCFILTTLFLFPVLVNIVLKSNALISNGSQMLIFRTLAIGVFFLPVGIVWSLSKTSKEKITGPGLPCMNWFYVTTGYLFGSYLLSGILDLQAILISLVVLQLALIILTLQKKQLPIKKMIISLSPALICLVALLFPGFSGQYSPELSAKRLFSTKVMVASNQGVSEEMLDHISESRLVTSRKSWFGTYTVWKNYGSQIQLRKNGYPFGVISKNLQTFPQHTGEVFRTIFPLILHQNPETVLIQGSGSGIALQTAISFPVQQIRCLEEDPVLVNLIRENVWNKNYENPETDKRVVIQNISPYLMTSMNGKKYDVIVCNPDESSLLSASPCFTTNYYQNVIHRMTENGIFCQYFRAIEYGVEPVYGTFKTFQSSFKESLAVEVAANEYLLLGTNSDSGLIRTDLISRLQSNHVRDVLSQIGWDWSVPLNLRVYQLNKLRREKQVAVNSIRNNWFSLAFPEEVVRWGNKPEEIMKGLTQAGIRVVDLPGIDNKDPQIIRRMKEVVSLFKLHSKNPDRPEAYRKVLKNQLMKPRLAMIKQVSYENSEEADLHPIEKHRKSYVKSLGAAVKKRKPDLELIQAVADHMAPYDPLITYFAHHEVAKLLERTGEDPFYELQCRLHMIYYSNSEDYSIRNIIAAIDLLADHPDLVDTKAERFDLLNGLLQQLKYRWELRSHAPELKPNIALNDVNYSTEAIDQSFAAIEGILPVENYSEKDWKNRRNYLEKKLLRPLHTYRTNLLPKAQQLNSRLEDKTLNENIAEELKLLENE